MTVREFIEKLQEVASTKGLLDTQIESVGAGECRTDKAWGVHHYFVVNVTGEKLQIFTDNDENKLSFEQVLDFDYRAMAYDENERMLFDIFEAIPDETKIRCIDTINEEEYDVPFEERDIEYSRHGGRTVIGVTGDKSEITITLG